jgi:hypothetical protein
VTKESAEDKSKTDRVYKTKMQAGKPFLLLG